MAEEVKDNTNATEEVENKKLVELSPEVKEDVKKIVETGVEMIKDAAEEGSKELKEKMEGKSWKMKLGLGAGAAALSGIVYVLTRFQDQIVNWVMSFF